MEDLMICLSFVMLGLLHLSAMFLSGLFVWSVIRYFVKRKKDILSPTLRKELRNGRR